MSQCIEIEIQVQIQKSAPLLAFLKKNAQLIGTEKQIDEYFTPAHDDFAKSRPIDRWLRLREADGTYFINYKNWHHDTKSGKTNYADEFESKIENIAALRKIFSVLNIKPLTTVNKTRQIWLYQDYEIAIDMVKDLGNFVEIEYKGLAKNPDPNTVTQDMIIFLKKVGCGKIVRNHHGYPFLLMFPDEARYEGQ